MPTAPHRTRGATRLTWTAFAVQVVALLFHQSWHAIGFGEPAGDLGHYLLLHFPLHLGVVLLGAAALWFLVLTGLSGPLLLLTTGAVLQHAGVAVDVVAVFGEGSHTPAALLLAAGGGIALTAAAARRRPRN